MVAACLLTGLTPCAVTPQDTATAQLERVRAIIRRNIASPSLDPRGICRLASISRSQLYCLFERHGGVVRYAQGMRLRMVHTMLAEKADSPLPIGTIAERVGSHDSAAFSRVFRREFGYTQREVRAAALGGSLSGLDVTRGAENPFPGDFIGVLRRLGAISRTAPAAT